MLPAFKLMCVYCVCMYVYGVFIQCMCMVYICVWYVGICVYSVYVKCLYTNMFMVHRYVCVSRWCICIHMIYIYGVHVCMHLCVCS